jgi:hypothetical protein
MAATGIVVDDAVVSEFNEVKLGRVKAKFLIYKIDDTKIVKEQMSSASATFNDLGVGDGSTILTRNMLFLFIRSRSYQPSPSIPPLTPRRKNVYSSFFSVVHSFLIQHASFYYIPFHFAHVPLVVVAAMPSDDCRYALYDMDFTTTDGRPANKLVFISW